MTLLHDWKRVVTKAHSYKLMALSVLFQGAELLLPLYQDVVPRRVFAGLSLLAMVGAMWARIVAQPKMYAPEAKK